MTLNEFLCYAEGRAEEQEFQLKNTRLLMWSMLSPHSKKGQLKRAEDLFELPSDKKIKRLKPNVSREEFEKKAKKIKARWQHKTP